MGIRLNPRPLLFLAAFFFLCSFSSCTRYQPSVWALRSDPEAEPEEEAPLETTDSPVFRKVSGSLSKETLQIAAEDVIDIRIKDQPELSGTVKVDPWGYIKTPYIEPVHVAGLNAKRVAHILREQYSEFFKMPPEVEVSIVEYNSQSVYVLGAVREPGRYPLVKGKPSTIRDAVVAAKLPTEQAALWRVWVIRQTHRGPAYKHVNLHKILYRGQAEEDVDLRPGDIVYLPMGLLDTFVSFIGRILEPITGVGRNAVLAVTTPN